MGASIGVGLGIVVGGLLLFGFVATFVLSTLLFCSRQELKSISSRAEQQQATIERQRRTVATLGKEFEKLRAFRQERAERQYLPHDQFTKWIYERARGL